MLDPNDQCYDELGSVLTEAHRDERAIAAFEMALKYHPEDFFAHVILAGLHERTGNRAKGRQVLASIKEPQDEKLTWYCTLVWYHATAKNETELMANMKKALELDRSGGTNQYFLEHPGSDTSVWKDKPPAERMDAMRTAASARNLLFRVKDVSAVLDQLERWTANGKHPLAGRASFSLASPVGGYLPERCPPAAWS